MPVYNYETIIHKSRFEGVAASGVIEAERVGNMHYILKIRGEGAAFQEKELREIADWLNSLADNLCNKREII